MDKLTTLSLSGLAAAILLYYLYTPWILLPVFLAVSLLLGAALAFLKGGYELRRVETQPRPPDPRTDAILYRMKVYPPRTLLPTLVSTNVDNQIHRVISLILQHHAKPLYSIVASNDEQFFASLVPEVWKVLHVLLNRVSQIDTLKLISHDLVVALRKHFLYFRGSTSQLRAQTFPDLKVFPFLENEEKEMDFLRKAVEALLCVCLDREYLECTPVKILIREYLVCRIIHPTIERISDPDYINQKLLLYLMKREELTKETQKRYAHSETYEDFMQHIKKCEDITELTHIRQSIITDIMQAKAVQRMKQASSTGLRVSNLPIAVSADKAKMLMERDLQLYINQLTTAKGVCERRIRKFGGEDYQQDHLEGEQAKPPDFPRPIPFDTIMMNQSAIKYFMKFLRKSNYGNLLEFWREVQSLSLAEDRFQKVTDIYRKYLTPGADTPVYPHRELLDSLEKVLEGDHVSDSRAIEAITEIQQSVYCELHEQHYESFLYSEEFKEFMEGESDNEDIGHILNLKSKGRAASPGGGANIASEDSIYQKRLTVLKRRLSDKDFALASLREPRDMTDSVARVRRLEKGRSELQEEIKQLQRYIEHTEEWFGTVGKWHVEVSNVDMSEEDGTDKDPLMILVIHRPEASDLEETITTVHIRDYSSTTCTTGSSGKSSISLEEAASDDGIISLSSEEEIPKSAGWVIGRKLSEFHSLHEKIQPICERIVFPPLPRKSVFPFMRQESQKYWDSYRDALQMYINKVIHNEKLIESEEVFNFLSPASADVHKEGKSSRSMLPKDGKSEEPILDTVSSLVSEVFELQDRSRVLRRQLYDLAQLTFGRGVEGELQDLMKWVMSEPMLVYYIESFQESMWPKGTIGEAYPDRSDEEKEKTQENAKERFLKCAPQTLQTVLGQRNCQIGFLKIFRAFQDRHANKQLFYSCFELLMYALIPELESVESDTSPEQ